MLDIATTYTVHIPLKLSTGQKALPFTTVYGPVAHSAVHRCSLQVIASSILPRFSTVRRLSSPSSYSTLQHQGLCCSSPSQALSNTTASVSSPLPRFHSTLYKSDRGDYWISLTLIFSIIFPYVPFLTDLSDIATKYTVLAEPIGRSGFLGPMSPMFK